MNAPVEPLCLVASAMRNEGPFIVEWVSWYRMLGFRVLVVTNDCTDHSVALLETLAEAGWLQHQAHQPPADEPPKRSAHRTLRNHPATAAADWVMLCDVDEFLVLHKDDTIQSYLARFDPAPLGIAFHWRCFGTGGERRWKDKPTHRSFLTGASGRDQVNHNFKSLFRRPQDFRTFGAHSPRGYSGPWEDDNHVWTDCAGKRLQLFHPNENPQKGTNHNRIRHGMAQMNHYILRSSESYAMKRGTPSSTAGADRYNGEFYRRFNRADALDTSALRFTEAFDRVHAQAMALPGVRRLHYLNCADYAARLAEHAGKPADQDRRVQRFRARAAES